MFGSFFNYDKLVTATTVSKTSNLVQYKIYRLCKCINPQIKQQKGYITSGEASLYGIHTAYRNWIVYNGFIIVGANAACNCTYKDVIQPPFHRRQRNNAIDCYGLAIKPLLRFFYRVICKGSRTTWTTVETGKKNTRV